MYMFRVYCNSGTSLIRTLLGPSFSGRIIKVSSFQGLLVWLSAESMM
jgi:hypothetical protein